MTLRRVSGALAGRATDSPSRRPHAIELRSRFSVVNLYLNLSCGLCQFGSLRIVYVYSIYKHSIYESGLVHGHGNHAAVRATGRRGRGRAAPRHVPPPPSPPRHGPDAASPRRGRGETPPESPRSRTGDPGTTGAGAPVVPQPRLCRGQRQSATNPEPGPPPRAEDRPVRAHRA